MVVPLVEVQQFNKVTRLELNGVKGYADFKLHNLMLFSLFLSALVAKGFTIIELGYWRST